MGVILISRASNNKRNKRTLESSPVDHRQEESKVEEEGSILGVLKAMKLGTWLHHPQAWP